MIDNVEDVVVHFKSPHLKNINNFLNCTCILNTVFKFFFFNLTVNRHSSGGLSGQ